MSYSEIAFKNLKVQYQQPYSEIRIHTYILFTKGYCYVLVFINGMMPEVLGHDIAETDYVNLTKQFDFVHLL